jgi:uncharacterized protein (TIGR02186 family)
MARSTERHGGLFSAPPGAGTAQWLAILVAAMFLMVPQPARALVADLSEHLIAITTGFTGDEVVLFGAVEQPGDVVVVVRGPLENIVVRRKERILGVWVNRTSVRFDRVPSYYAVAANRPLTEIAGPSVLERHDIGLQQLDLRPRDEDEMDADDLAPYREALIRRKQHAGTYGLSVDPVAFLGNRLFRTRLAFPENVPTGQYLVSVFLVSDGNVVAAQTTPLSVRKVGIGAEIFLFAHGRPALYGLVAILVAISAGWLASLPFRRA